MALRKLYIVIDCSDDGEKDAVQQVLNEVSNARMFCGSDVVSMLPVFNRNKADLMELFRMIQQGGVKSLMSVKGGKLIAKLAMK